MPFKELLPSSVIEQAIYKLKIRYYRRLFDLAQEDISLQENPATATITVSAIEVEELTEEEQSDKPDGMATLTVCI